MGGIDRSPRARARHGVRGVRRNDGIRFYFRLQSQRCGGHRRHRRGGGQRGGADAPVREGYRFDGWFTTASGETPYDFSGAVNADTTVYAGWTQVYVVTLDANYDEGEDAVREVVAGDAMDTPEAPVRAGYAFKGWFTDATGGAQYNFNAAPTRDMTLYAHWAEAYAITLDYNYDGAPADGTYYAEKDVASVGPQDPVREGYAFNGWYSDAACTQAFSFARPITSATTIYAGWKAQLVMEAEYVDFTGLSGPAIRARRPART